MKISNLGRLCRVGALLCGGLIAAAVHDDKRAGKIIGKIEGEKSLMADDTAAVSITDGIMAIVIAAVTMGIGAMILSKIFPSIVGSDNESNETIAAVKSSTWDAVGLLPVALIVFAAVIIIGVVMYLRQ